MTKEKYEAHRNAFIPYYIEREGERKVRGMDHALWKKEILSLG